MQQGWASYHPNSDLPVPPRTISSKPDLIQKLSMSSKSERQALGILPGIDLESTPHNPTSCRKAKVNAHPHRYYRRKELGRREEWGRGVVIASRQFGTVCYVTIILHRTPEPTYQAISPHALPHPTHLMTTILLRQHFLIPLPRQLQNLLRK